MTQVDVASASAEPAARTPASTELDTVRRSPLYPWLLLAAFAAVALLAVWMISPRFEIDTPSLVDDWSTISESPRRLEALARLENPDEGRFVPSLVVWNYLQWHTFDAPTGLVGPNAWGILRVLILVGGLCLLTAVALPARRGGWNAALDAALVAIPAFAVFTVPKFARDVARFGPQEPLLVGGLALGGALLVLAFRALLVPGPLRASWRVVALAVAGSAFWLLGAYHKETSVCAIPLIAGFVLAGRSRLGSWGSLETPRKVALGVLAAVVALPLLHVAIATARISARGDLIYGAEVGTGGLIDGLRDLYDWAHEPLPDNARLLMVAAVVLTAAAARLAAEDRLDRRSERSSRAWPRSLPRARPECSRRGTTSRRTRSSPSRTRSRSPACRPSCRSQERSACSSRSCLHPERARRSRAGRTRSSPGRRS